MTLHHTVSPVASDLNAPVLPEDRARAGELYAQVTGTERESEYRSISTRHPNKNASRATYRAFLDEIEAMFAAPPVPVPVAEVPEEALTELEPEIGSRHPEDSYPSGDEERDADESEAEQPGSDDEGEPADPEPTGEDEVSDPVAPGSDPVVMQGALLPVRGGLVSQLASMLGEGGQLTLTMIRLGDEVTLSLTPKPGAVPLIVTGLPGYFDEHLMPALTPYVQVQRDVYAACSAAAGQARKDGQKELAKSTPKAVSTPPKAAPKATLGSTAKASRVKEHTLTLSAAEGSTLSYDKDGTTSTLVIGANTVPEGMLTVVAEHPALGRHSKTVSVSSARSYDFRDLQGGKVTFEVQPEGAALTLWNGETVLPAHGETFLAPGTWEYTAEADGYAPLTQTVSVTAGKAQKVKVQLTQNVNALF